MHNPVIDISAAALIVLIGTAFGRKLSGLLSGKAGGDPIFAFGLGMGALAYLVLAIGLVGRLYGWVLLLVMGLLAVVSLPQIVGLLRDLGRWAKDQARIKLGPADGLIAFSLAALGALGLIAALGPPSGLDWDGLAYHLAVPKMYLNRHSVFYVPFISHSNFPFLTEMLYTLGLSLGSTSIAKLFHFSMYLGTASAIYALCRRHASPLVGKVGALVFMSAPIVIWESGVAYADVTTALYITLTVYAVLNWPRTGESRWLIVGGVMGGFALGTKALAAVPILVLCMWVLATSGLNHRWGRGLSLSLAFGAIALLVGSPWYVKSYVYTGNPVYPFLYNVFGGRNWSREAAEAYRAAQLTLGAGRGAGDFLILPWSLTMDGFKFFDSPRLFGLIGMAFLGLIPVQVLSGKLNRLILISALTCIVVIAAWFFMMQQARYLIMIVPLLSILAASGVETSHTSFRIGRHVVSAFLGLVIVLGIVTGGAVAVFQARAAFGLEPRDEYLSRTLDVYDAQDYINTDAPPGAKVVLFDEVRGFYLDREYIWGNPGHHELIPWRGFKDGCDMVDFFLKRGFGCALVNWNFADTKAVYHRLIGDAIAHGWMREVYASNGVSVYEFVVQ
jgi:hypothetical protein